MSDTSYLVCASTGHFADDVPARCAACDAAIVHRPHVPAHAVPICARCATDLIVTGEVPPVIKVTAETLREVALFNATTKGRH